MLTLEIRMQQSIFMVVKFFKTIGLGIKQTHWMLQFIDKFGVQRGFMIENKKSF